MVCSNVADSFNSDFFAAKPNLEFVAITVCPLQAMFGPLLGQKIIKSWLEATSRVNEEAV